MQAVRWAIKIADILCYLHSQDPPVIHRDLTPDNIVLSKEDIFLIDFGAANQFVGAATGTVVGKQAYIPPEQLRGKSSLQSDLYAFGVQFTIFLTGTDPMPLAEASVKEKIPAIDEELERLIGRCTAYELEDRIGSANELLKELLICAERLELKERTISLAEIQNG